MFIITDFDCGKGQRQASAPEPQRGQPQAHEDIPQQELEPAQVLASIQALQLDLDFCRGTNRERLVQLQQQECAVEQKHQDLIFLMQQYLTLMDKDQKDEAVQTEVTSYVATHSHSNSSCEILREHRELLQQLGAQEEQSQGLRHSLAQLQEELGAAQAQEQQSLQQLSRAKETIQDLQQEVASKRKHLAELVQQVQDMATLQAELARAQQEKAKQEEKIANYEEQRQQLHWELRKLQGSQEQSKQEAQSLRERLQELSSQAQHWQQLHQDSEQALAAREEELVVCKVELAFLKEELSKAMEQVETLGCSHALACSDSSRLCKDRELVLVNISQCVKEQM
ncbi:Pmfbp1 [Columba livia]|nr:Pmfbp1 [Columba livia]